MTRRRPHRAQAGFTLVEAMIAMTAGLVTVLATYHLGSVSSRTFNEQMRITETQGSLRSAMDQLQRDVPRAGFLAAADSRSLSNCAGIVGATISSADLLGGRLFGARIFAKGSHDNSVVANVLAPSAAPSDLTRADRLELFGNFHSGDVFKISSEGASNQLIFEGNRESFRRNFVERDTSGAEAFSTTAFNDTFPVGRMVRIESDRHVFFRRVEAVNPDPTLPSITLSSSVPDVCFKRSTALVTPLSWIRYQVEPVEGESFKRLKVTSSARGADKRVALVRSELNPQDGSVKAGSERLVLDYAVEFRVDGVVPGATPNTWRTLTDKASAGEAVDTEDLQGALRTLRIVLSARAQDVETRPQGGSYRDSSDPLSPLLGFPVEVAEKELRRARVRSLRQEIFLPNMGL